MFVAFRTHLTNEWESVWRILAETPFVEAAPVSGPFVKQCLFVAT
jgi:hypothetical protein